MLLEHNISYRYMPVITLTCRCKVTSSINDACLCLQSLLVLDPLLYISIDDLDPNCYLIFAFIFYYVYYIFFISNEVFLKRHVRTSKYEPIVDKLELVHSTSNYAQVCLSGGREKTI